MNRELPIFNFQLPIEKTNGGRASETDASQLAIGNRESAIDGPRWGKIWLTAQALAGRAEGKSSVSLRTNEFLTPAAQDYAAARNLLINRLQSGLEPPHAVAPASVASEPRLLAAVTGVLGVVLARPDALAEGALASLARSGIQMKDCRIQSCWMASSIELGRAIAAGELAGGVLLDRHASSGMALAGKLKGIRPVQGVSIAAVQAGLRQFDANFLVVGWSGLSVFQIKGMVETFAAGRARPQADTPLLERIKKLET